MNILVVVANSEAGGGQIFAARLASYLSKAHNVYLYKLYPDDNTNQLTPHITTSLNVINSPITCKIPRFWDNLLKIIGKITKKVGIENDFRTYVLGRFFHYPKYYFIYILKKYNIEIINSHLFFADEFVVNTVSATKIRVPVVVTMHGCYESLPQKVENFNARAIKILNNIQGLVYIADKNLSILNELSSGFSNNSLKKVKIYNGFPSEMVSKCSKDNMKLDEKAFVFGMVARGIAEKGWKQAIEAFLLVQDRHPVSMQTYLILIGEGPYLNTLKELYQDRSNILFVGFTPNPIEWITLLHIGLLPTYFAGESLPNTVIEYLYCGKPVIATNIGEISKMIDYEGNSAGFIVDYDKHGKADVQQLTTIMQTYVNDNTLLQKHSILAKKAFQKFGMEVCISRYNSLFEQLLVDYRSNSIAR